MPTQVVITGVTGTPPFEISVCDITNSFCVVENPSVVIPPNYIFDLPFPFEGSTSFIVKITDNQGCEVFHPYYCLTPTPTPTLTPTPTSTQTNFCYCLVVRNTGATDGSFSYIDCNNVQNNNVIVPATVTIFVCGSNPTNVSGLSITYNGFCVDGSCLPPSQTPTQTPTPTPTISVTPTVTPTISVTPSVTPTISVTPTVTPTISVTPTITPTVTPTISVTPTMTPTPTTSPFPTNFKAYLFIEPQSASTIVGNYMFTNGSPQFFGFTNFTQPSANAINFDLEMNLYVNYVGWTNGQLPSIIPSDVPQTTGGNDSYGNPIIAYNFETVRITSFTVGDKGWYTWLIPVSATNSQLQTQIDVSLNNPNIFTTVITEPTIRSNTFTYTGSVIPPGVYRVYTSYPSLNFYLNNAGNNIYFKGNLVGP